MKQRGFTLIELMIVVTLVITGAALAAAWSSRADRQTGSTRLTNELSMLESRIRDGWSAEATFATLTTGQVIARGYMPSSMSVDANTLRNALGGTWAVTPDTWAGGVAEAAGASFRLTATNVPTDICVDSVIRGARHYLGILVNNGADNWVVTNVGQTPAVGTVTTACTAPGGAVAITWITN